MSDTNGRTKATVLLTLACVLLAGMTGHMALGWGDGAALRATVLQAIAALPTQPAPAASANDPQGTPATPEQRQAIEGALLGFLKAMQGHDFEAVKALIMPDVDEDDRREPSPYYKPTGTPFTDRYAEVAAMGSSWDGYGKTLPPGTRLELLKIVTKPERSALVGVTVDRPRWLPLTNSAQGWRIDLGRLGDPMTSETVQREIGWLNETAGTVQLSDNLAIPLTDNYFALLVLSPENTYRVEEVLSNGDQAWVKLQTHSRVLGQISIEPDGEMTSSEISLVPGPVDPEAYATSRTREVNQQQSCLSNLKQLQLGIMQYCQDYDEKMPVASKWADSIIEPYVQNRQTLICPAVPDKPGYAMNYKLSRQPLGIVSDPARTICLFDSSLLVPNAYDLGKPAGASLPSPGRHLSLNNASFADGHARGIGAYPPGKPPARPFQVVRPPAPPPPPGVPGGPPMGMPGGPGSYDDEPGEGKSKSGGDER